MPEMSFPEVDPCSFPFPFLLRLRKRFGVAEKLAERRLATGVPLLSLRLLPRKALPPSFAAVFSTVRLRTFLDALERLLGGAAGCAEARLASSIGVSPSVSGDVSRVVPGIGFCNGGLGGCADMVIVVRRLSCRRQTHWTKRLADEEARQLELDGFRLPHTLMERHRAHVNCSEWKKEKANASRVPSALQIRN